MTNFVRNNIDREARSIGDNVAYVGFFSVLFYGYAVAGGASDGVAQAIGFWALFYVVYAPLFLRSIAIRKPAGDTWRAAAYVAYGALPFSLFIPFWSELTAWPASIAAYPVVLLWATAALILAGLERPLRGTPRRRAAFLGIAGGLYAVAAGPVYLGFAIGLFTGAWIPPDDETVLAGMAVIGGLPWALMAAYAAVELLGRANTTDAPTQPS